MYLFIPRSTCSHWFLGDAAHQAPTRLVLKSSVKYIRALRAPQSHPAPEKQRNKKIINQIIFHSYTVKTFVVAYLPTLSTEDAEKALSGRLKFHPIPSGIEQGATRKKIKQRFSEHDTILSS